MNKKRQKMKLTKINFELIVVSDEKLWDDTKDVASKFLDVSFDRSSENGQIKSDEKSCYSYSDESETSPSYSHSGQTCPSSGNYI